MLAAHAVAANQRLRGVFRQPRSSSTSRRRRARCSACSDLFGSAKPLADYVAPAQTVCNYWNYWLTLLPSTSPTATQVGYTQA